jgi:hypothetical protein
MSSFTYIYGLKTSFITGNFIDKNILDLNRKVEENNRKVQESNKEILKLNNYIKMMEEKLSCFFDVDDEFIIEGN